MRSRSTFPWCHGTSRDRVKVYVYHNSTYKRRHNTNPKVLISVIIIISAALTLMLI